MKKHRAHLLFEPDLYVSLLRAARAEDRTFTAEIKKRLRESLRREGRAEERPPARGGRAVEDHA